tara:strand:+ start:94 stop:351 length:258 start_codon:yes stop_codon:yes gene_type:complete
MKYLNQTTVNVIAIATAVVAGLSLVSVGQGPDKAMKKQLLMNRQLDYDLGRIKTCGELKRYGVEVHPDAPMSYLCADVIYTGNEL